MIALGLVGLIGVVSYFVFTAPTYAERLDDGLVRFA